MFPSHFYVRKRLLYGTKIHQEFETIIKINNITRSQETEGTENLFVKKKILNVICEHQLLSDWLKKSKSFNNLGLKHCTHGLLFFVRNFKGYILYHKIYIN